MLACGECHCRGTHSTVRARWSEAAFVSLHNSATRWMDNGSEWRRHARQNPRGWLGSRRVTLQAEKDPPPSPVPAAAVPGRAGGCCPGPGSAASLPAPASPGKQTTALEGFPSKCNSLKRRAATLGF